MILRIARVLLVTSLAPGEEGSLCRRFTLSSVFLDDARSKNPLNWHNRTIVSILNEKHLLILPFLSTEIVAPKNTGFAFDLRYGPDLIRRGRE